MLIIDRFEGDFAVVEYKEGRTFNLPRSLLPPGAKEGDVLQLKQKKKNRNSDGGAL